VGRNNTDYTGQKFGRLEVIGRDKNWSFRRNGTRVKYWVSLCDCGTVFKCEAHELVSRHRTSCGCNKYRPRTNRHPLSKPDITGQRFGMLQVLGRNELSTEIHGGRKRRLWKCQCDCGKTIDLARESIESGKQQSCGCLRHDANKWKNKRQPNDIKGQRFGNLVALDMLPDAREWNSAIWRCQCDCGNVVNFNRKRLGNGIRLNCGDKTKHQFYLKQYPPSPDRMPDEVWEIVNRYLVHTKAEYKSKYRSQAIEDEKFNRLLRAAFILHWRRSQGEELDELFEQRYIWKYLRFARVAVKVRDIREKRGIKSIIRDDLNQIGRHMTDIILAVDPEGNLCGGSILRANRKRFKFKTC
jgi:hypothetical protein